MSSVGCYIVIIIIFIVIIFCGVGSDICIWDERMMNIWVFGK